jgi:hypothetical protein
MGAGGKISEAIAGGNAAAITAEEAFAGLAQEAVVFVLGVPSGNRVLVETERLGSIAAGSKYLAIVEAVVAHSAAQLNPKQPPFGGHGAPSRGAHDCNGHCHIWPLALSLMLAHTTSGCFGRKTALANASSMMA